ncbi:protein ABHD18-like [Diadema antillarum]|uniref:protein ABHD18-like n=1 Tax=Diadema antillarum TaxID=105358 RepID=UPI003A83ED41
MYQKASTFDVIYRRLLLSKFFTRGWGSPATIKRQFDFLRVLADRSTCQQLVDENYPVSVDSDVEKGEVRILEGHFRSPFDKYLPNVMPSEVKTARFQLVVPTRWPTHRKPVCIHMAGTGDHFFWRRRTFLARPLIKEYGIGSLILENPYYGCRKPKEQLRSSLRHVNELFVMGGGLILEGLVLLHWCERQGFGPLGLTGISMGGHMATLTATNWHKPIPLIPCLSWTSATPVFTEGVLSGSIPWPLLVTQYLGHTEYEGEIMKKLSKCPKTDAFRIGQEFVWNYPESLKDLKEVKLARKSTAQGTNDTSKSEILQEMSSARVQECLSGSTSGAKMADGDAQRDSRRKVMECKESESSSTVKNFESLDTEVPSESLTSKSAIELETMAKDSLQATIVKSVWQESIQSKSVEDREANVCSADIRRHDGEPSHSVQAEHSGQAHDRRKGTSGGEKVLEVRSAATETTIKSFTVSKSQAVNGTSSVHLQQKIKITKNYTDIARNSSKGIGDYKDLKKEALEFMRGVMDVTTFVGNFSVPVDPSLVIVVTALRDGYIPRKGVPSLEDLWPGVEVRYVDCGHISAFLFKQTEFRKAINDAFSKYLAKYDNDDNCAKSNSQSAAEV